MKVIFVTGNQGKLREIRELLGEETEVVTMREAGFTGEIEPGGEEVRRELERVIAMRQMLCIRSLTGGRPDSGWILLSRQPRWGGLSDGKGGEKAPAVLDVRINGADGRPLRQERLPGGR